MQGIVSYHVAPPGNLCIRQEDGLIRKATDVETILFSRMKVSLSSRYRWKTSKRRGTPNPKTIN